MDSEIEFASAIQADRAEVRPVSTSNDIQTLIERGEGPTTEFKSSFRWDLTHGRVNRDLQTVVSKTVAAFLNSGGGTLIIGIDDNGSVLGIEQDIQSLGRRSIDGFELALRTVFSNQLGPEVSPKISIDFEQVEGLYVCRVVCDQHHAPVYLRDGETLTFYVRDGNRSVPLDTRSAFSYIQEKWRPHDIDTIALANQIADELMRRADHGSQTIVPLPAAGGVPLDPIPPWLTVGTRRVLNLFLGSLSQSSSWSRIFIISPWLSEFNAGALLSFEQFISRLQSDRTIAYIATRPPSDLWHQQAIEKIGKSGRANIVVVPGLHAKLYIAETQTGSFALLGSANFTQQSLANREVGVLISAYADGHRVIRELSYEAGDIYRSASRSILYKAQLGGATKWP